MLWLAAASGCSRPGGSLKAAATPVVPRPIDLPQAAVFACAVSRRRLVARTPTGRGGNQLACRITQYGAFFVVLLRKSACKFTLSIFRPSFPRDTGAHAKRGAQRRLPAITSAPADSSGDARRKLGTPAPTCSGAQMPDAFHDSVILLPRNGLQLLRGQRA